MPETKVSTGDLAAAIEYCRKLLEGAQKVEVEVAAELENSAEGRIELDKGRLEVILASLKAATAALALGCQPGVYGLFVTRTDPTGNE